MPSRWGWPRPRALDPDTRVPTVKVCALNLSLVALYVSCAVHGWCDHHHGVFRRCKLLRPRNVGSLLFQEVFLCLLRAKHIFNSIPHQQGGLVRAGELVCVKVMWKPSESCCSCDQVTHAIGWCIYNSFGRKFYSCSGSGLYFSQLSCQERKLSKTGWCCWCARTGGAIFTWPREKKCSLSKLQVREKVKYVRQLMNVFAVRDLIFFFWRSLKYHWGLTCIEVWFADASMTAILSRLPVLICVIPCLMCCIF